MSNPHYPLIYLQDSSIFYYFFIRSSSLVLCYWFHRHLLQIAISFTALSFHCLRWLSFPHPTIPSARTKLKIIIFFFHIHFLLPFQLTISKYYKSQNIYRHNCCTNGCSCQYRCKYPVLQILTYCGRNNNCLKMLKHPIETAGKITKAVISKEPTNCCKHDNNCRYNQLTSYIYSPSFHCHRKILIKGDCKYFIIKHNINNYHEDG